MSVQPISPRAVISRILEIYRDQFAVLLSTALILFGIEFVVHLLIPGSGLALTILFWALGVLYQGMVVELVQDIQDGRRDHSIGNLIRSVDQVFWPLAAVSILFGFALAIGFILLIIPGLILMVIWSVVAPVTVLERPGVFAAFTRSQQLVYGNGWNVFAVILLVVLAVAAISVAAVLVAGSLGSLGGALVQWAVNAALAPFTALSASVLYFELLGRSV
jgi:hypothetical protein